MIRWNPKFLPKKALITKISLTNNYVIVDRVKGIEIIYNSRFLPFVIPFSDFYEWQRNFQQFTKRLEKYEDSLLLSQFWKYHPLIEKIGIEVAYNVFLGLGRSERDLIEVMLFRRPTPLTIVNWLLDRKLINSGYQYYQDEQTAVETAIIGLKKLKTTSPHEALLRDKLVRQLTKYFDKGRNW